MRETACDKDRNVLIEMLVKTDNENVSTQKLLKEGINRVGRSGGTRIAVHFRNLEEPDNKCVVWASLCRLSLHLISRLAG
jgi:hypothetical protein